MSTNEPSAYVQALVAVADAYDHLSDYTGDLARCRTVEEVLDLLEDVLGDTKQVRKAEELVEFRADSSLRKSIDTYWGRFQAFWGAVESQLREVFPG